MTFVLEPNYALMEPTVLRGGGEMLGGLSYLKTTWLLGISGNMRIFSGGWGTLPVPLMAAS